MSNILNTEIVIVGGGLVGALLSLALAEQGIQVVVIEKNDNLNFNSCKTIALSASSRNLLIQLKLWNACASYCCAIKAIHVSEQGYFGISRLEAKQLGQEALGYVVTEAHLLQAAYQLLKNKQEIKLLLGCTVRNHQQDERGIYLNITGQNTAQVQAQVCAVVDGANSVLRKNLNITATIKDHQQLAVVGQVCLKDKADYVAYERFTPEGPIAMLPVSARKYAFVWTQSIEQGQAKLALTPALQLQELQRAFGYRLGVFTELEHVGHYPLCSVVADQLVKPRVVLCGSAAHHLHPVAGQGLNLCLRDVALLVEHWSIAKKQKKDLGDIFLLETYARLRAKDTAQVMSLTETLIGVFGINNPVVRVIRNLGLIGFDCLPYLKKQFIARASYGSSQGVSPLITQVLGD